MYQLLSARVRLAPTEGAFVAAEHLDDAARVLDCQRQAAVLRRDDRRRLSLLAHAEDHPRRMTGSLERGQIVDVHVLRVGAGVLEARLRSGAFDDLYPEASQVQI